MTTTMVEAGWRVAFISTEVSWLEMQLRMFSATAGIPYSRIMDGIKTVCIDPPNGMSRSLPDPEVYGIEATGRALGLVNAMNTNLLFAKIESLGHTPDQTLNSLIEEISDRVHALPDIVIYDYLKPPHKASEEINVRQMRADMRNAAEALRRLAHTRNVLVFAFCQADQTLNTSKKVGPLAIREYGEIADSFDAFFGISNRRRDDEDIEDGGDIRHEVQHLTVVSKTNPTQALVPVVRNFAYQRFESYSKGEHNQNKAGDPDKIRLARRIEATSEFPGYVLARRERLKEIFQCGVPYAINLYALFLLVSDKTGSSFYGRERLSKTLGLSTKQLRTATDILFDHQLISTGDQRRNRSLRYIVLDWKEDQNPESKGYFKLFRNLRDTSRSTLLADPELFRVWLYVLTEARMFPDEAADLQPGDVMIKPQHAEETVSIDSGRVLELFDKLVLRGSANYRGIDSGKLGITNWNLYQKFVHAPKPPAEGVGADLQIDSGNYGATSGQLQDNTRAGEGQLSKIGRGEILE